MMKKVCSPPIPLSLSVNKHSESLSHSIILGAHLGCARLWKWVLGGGDLSAYTLLDLDLALMWEPVP